MSGAAIAETTWRPLVQRLVERLAADGDLHDPAWRAALLAVPRHEFVPRYYEQEPNSRPLRWKCHQPYDAESTRRWLELVYSPTTLITELADYIGRGIQVPVSSSTKPDLMIRMLEALRVAEGTRVLEIGTGTGYNAALLAHRFGGPRVFSVDIDSNLVTEAARRLDRLGYAPTLVTADGACGLPEHAPYDRIIATCALGSVPSVWIDELRAGGLALVHIEGPLGAGKPARARRAHDPPTLEGRFLPWWGCFIHRRTTASSGVGQPRPSRTTEPPTSGTTSFDPAELDGGKYFPFLVLLYLPAGVHRSITLDDDQVPITEVRAPDGSWCEITREPDTNDHRTVRQAGPTALVDQLERAWQRWQGLGAPAWHEFGLTATTTEQHIWHHDPNNGPRWVLPARA